MGQVFPRSANLIAKASIVVVVLLVVGALGYFYVSSQAYTPVVRTQPVPFSHQQHVGDLGLDCRYCHIGVESSPFAGLPSTQICMNCHLEVLDSSDKLAPVRDSSTNGTPIVWTRVNYLPDFVYFDHSAHVSKGVACVMCHGQVDQMQVMVQAKSLQMGWCMDCHRNPAPNIRPSDQVTNMNWQPPAAFDQVRQHLIDEYHVESKISCSTCHR